jgi:hypothetical protein
MKVRTNAKSKPKKSSDKNDNPNVQNTEKNPRYSIRQISNGWIANKSWQDEKGNYKEEEVYHKENPIKDTQVV